MILIPAFCADDSNGLGRLDYASLSEETLMEMLTDGISNLQRICEYDSPSDLSDWRSVNLTGDQVTNIRWEDYGLKGSIHLQWTPSHVRWLTVAINELVGTVDLCHLPETLEKLDLSRNMLTGSLHLNHLPDRLGALYLYSNRFSGSVTLTELPKSLKMFSVRENLLEGTLDLTALPADLNYLWLSYNAFSGETDFSKISASMIEFDITNTKLSGTIYGRSRPSNQRLKVNGSGVKVISSVEKTTK
mmetsp:Transcript_20450/g.31919  ORF Transcript_20450/g.31919 Transcript_20450/m.31919 type:complete len:246 (-) Transcript_20450:20-757(-)